MRKLYALLVAAIVAGSTLISAPAHAAGVIHFWDLASQANLMYTHDGADRPSCFSMPLAYDGGSSSNRTSSLYNGSGHKMRVYDASNCLSAPYLDIAIGYQGTLSQYGWDNRVSAFYLY